ncbi:MULTISPECIES: polysaccharide lyase family protein [Acidobacteriaceae]|uniref:polysaccharide lyase family protein n=1 Tax=Acidobacteriaceae TaxID=204434 RepID=UPI00131EB994|nr:MULTISPECIES: polysaccharide lyase family protein [Acidobacteriaceae]MDW5265387.1 polysaccharide lyase family protein [Edaphobacter sp.]
MNERALTTVTLTNRQDARRLVISRYSVILFLIVWSCLVSAHSQEHVLWQIGKFDDSSQEFSSQGIDYNSPEFSVVYMVGKSHEADWPRFQPGPANAIDGGRLHPFSIVFPLLDVTQGLYQLRVAMMYETPRMSALQLDVNGHKGVFYFHPRLDYGAGDWEGTFVPQTSRDVKTIDIPTQWLKRGANTFILTAIDTPSTPQSSMGNIAPGQSGIVYDALAFTHNDQKRYAPGSILATVLPTIFYKTSSTGLQEIVDVYPELEAGAVQRGEVTFAIGGKQFTQPLVLEGEFGEAHLRFAVPEWHGEVQAVLSVDGHRFPQKLEAAKKWILDIVPHEHLDIGFTDYAPKVAELQSESVDGVLDLLKQKPNFRWTLDGSWVAQKYLQSRSQERTEQFLAAVRAGEIVIPAQFANELTGTASLEELIHSLYYSRSLAGKYDLPIGAANITDVPSYSWSYASVLHDAGVKYLAAGSNSWRAPAVLLGRWNEKSPFYWEGPDGGRVMMWYSRAYLQLASMYGTPPTLPAVEDATPVFLQAYTRPDYTADSVIVYGSQLENTPLSREQVNLPEMWAKEYAYPKMTFTTFEAAMASLEKQFGGHLKVYRGDFGPYWEDGVTSDAKHVAIFRRSQPRILTAEKMSVLPVLLNPDLRPDAARTRDAWENMLLFNEHTWTAASATTQPEGDESRRQLQQKDLESVIAHNDIAKSIEQSWMQLESLVNVNQDSVLVFNSLSWNRGGWVDVDLPDGQILVDAATKQPVPQTILKREAGLSIPGFGGPTNRVRFQAADVPAMGYRTFAIVPKASSSASLQHSLPASTGNVLENRYYRITLDPQHGAIKSIYDKSLRRELVDSQSSFLFGSYVYVEGGDDAPRNALYRYGVAQHLPALNPIEASHGKLVGITRNTEGLTAVLTSSAPNTPIIQLEITLPSDRKSIELTYKVQKMATLRKEAAYFAFSFAGKKPDFNYETQNAWANPARDELIGGSREWYAVNHWAATTSDGVTAAILPLDAPIVTFGDIVRGTWPSEFHPRSNAIFSWIMSNYWDTNYASSQGGNYVFRYKIVSMNEFDPQQLTRTGWEIMTPLESDPVKPSPYPHVLGNTAASFLHINSDAVVATTWKMAEDGEGSIIRLEETAGRPESVVIHSDYLRVQHAWLCNILEQKQKELQIGTDGIDLTIPAYGVVTVRMETRPVAGHQEGNRGN